MLARRLLMIALVMLVVTALGSAVAPPPRRAGPPPAPPSASADAGAVLERTVSTARARPATVVVETGDILTLTVESDEPGAVELRELGTLRAIAPSAPVVYDVLAHEAGEYPVLFGDEQRTVATVRVVSPRE